MSSDSADSADSSDHAGSVDNPESATSAGSADTDEPIDSADADEPPDPLEPAGSPGSPGSPGSTDAADTGAHAPPEGSEPAPDESFYATFSVVELLGVHMDLPSQYPVVTLQEGGSPYRQLSFPVGLPEGIALSHAFRKIGTPRPLTHELLASVLQRLHADVIAVRLVGRRSGTYLAELEVMGPNGREVFSCRPTDAITLALRVPVPAPMLADVRLLDDADDVLPDEPA
jgi:uncharacterized protein